MSHGLKYLFVFVLAFQNFACTVDDKKTDTNVEKPVEIVVNPAIDLLSLMSRLAGINQYQELLLPEYLAEVEEYFGHLRDHPSIRAGTRL